MGIEVKQFKQYIIQPALALLDMKSPSAEALLLGTAAQESKMGHYIHQLGGGPALGVFQMESATFQDIWQNYIRFRPAIASRLAHQWPLQPEPEALVTDLLLAAVMCRLHYRRVFAPLPEANDVNGLAAYWKRYYNTAAGRGTEAEFMTNWSRYGLSNLL
ncbi:MAG: hypothetical protein HQL67_04125 [Magnetococcales bacterium]|nr:hypothetical protein [Magnetococcales bacterium]